MAPIAFALLLSLALEPQPARTLPELEKLYLHSCAGCHGPDGSALSPEGKRLKGLDFTSSSEMQGRTDAELGRVIRKGVFFGLKMPAFRSELSDLEVEVMVREIIRKARKGKTIGSGDDYGKAR